MSGGQERTAGAPETDREGGRLAAIAWPLLVVVVTAAYSVLPFLASRYFYLRGDSGGQFIPTWFHLGEMVRTGQWPPVMDADTWLGGNYAAEALFGVYNPVNALNWVAVSLFDDLALASLLVKGEFLTLLALGCYLLAREYGAARWASACVAVAVPYSGFTLYWDAASWFSGLVAFAYLPYVWWALRRTANRRLNPVWAFLVGALAVTQGNPYGVLGIAVAGGALLVESALRRHWAAVGRLALVGAAIACVIPLVFLPLVETAPLTYRADIPSIRNANFMRPAPGYLLALGSPTYQPDIITFLDPMRVPAVYLAWWVPALLPWLRWSSLRGRLAELSGVLVVAAVYFMLTMAPSVLWMFRWPLRLVEYVWLPLLVLLAVLMSAGLHRDHLPARLLASLGAVALGSWIAWAETPEQAADHLVAFVLVGCLAAAIAPLVRMPAVAATTALSLLLIGGTGAVLGLQTRIFPENESAARWYFPTSVSKLRDRFADRYPGTVLQFALVPRGDHQSKAEIQRHWDDVLLGSMLPVAGVDAVNTYSGMGYLAFTDTLAMHYSGSARRAGYPRLWEHDDPDRPRLADLIKLDTVVVMRRQIPNPRVPEGWGVAEQTSTVTVLRRVEPQPWPQSRLSWASEGVVVESAVEVSDYVERVELAALPADRPSTVVFARLAWPGYEATLDGRPVEMDGNGVGLATVTLPPGTDPGTLELRFTPPGQVLGLAATGAGLVLCVLLGAVDVVRGRRRLSRERVQVRPEDRALATR